MSAKLGQPVVLEVVRSLNIEPQERSPHIRREVAFTEARITGMLKAGSTKTA